MPDPPLQNGSVGSSRNSGSSTTYTYDRRSQGRKPLPQQLPHSKVGNPSIPPLARTSSNLDQPLVRNQGFIKPPNGHEAARERHIPSFRNPSPPKFTPHVTYPSVPDMSRRQTSSPEPVSPQHRGSRYYSYYGQSPNHRHVPPRERGARNYSPSPPPSVTRDSQNYRYIIREVEQRTYSQSPPPLHSRDTYYPDRFRLEAELEHYRARYNNLQIHHQQEMREAQIRAEAEESYKLQLEEREAAREEVKKELEQDRIDAEKAAREKLEAERRVEEAIREREKEQAKVLEREIRLNIEAEKQAEEADKKLKARMEENLELLMKTKMAETLDELMETAKQRFHTAANPVPSKKSSSRFEGRGGLYTTGTDKVSYSGQSPRHDLGMSVDGSYATSSYKPEKSVPSPIEDEWEQVQRPVPEAVPDPPGYGFGSEDESIHQTDYSRKHSWSRPYMDEGSRPRGRTRHRTHAGGRHYRSPKSQKYHTSVSPDLVHQIAHAVADILRPEYDDLMFQGSRGAQSSRQYNSRTAGYSLGPSEYSYTGSPSIQKPTRKHCSGEYKRQRHVVGTSEIPGLYGRNIERVPSINHMSSFSPSHVETDFRDDQPPAHPKTSLSEKNNDYLGSSKVKVSVSHSRGHDTSVAEDEGYRDRNGTRVTSSESMTRVNSSISAAGSKLQGRITPPPANSYEPEKHESLTGGLLKTETARQLYQRTIGRGMQYNHTDNSHRGRARSWPRTGASDVE